MEEPSSQLVISSAVRRGELSGLTVHSASTRYEKLGGIWAVTRRPLISFDSMMSAQLSTQLCCAASRSNDYCTVSVTVRVCRKDPLVAVMVKVLVPAEVCFAVFTVRVDVVVAAETGFGLKL